MTNGIPSRDEFIKQIIMRRSEGVRYLESACAIGNRAEASAWEDGIHQFDKLLAKFGVRIGA